MTLAAYLHQLDPFAIHISGNIGIRWYGLAYALGFIAVFFITSQMAKRKLTLMPQPKVMDFVVVMVISTMVGGRLGYCLFYEPSLLVTFSSDIPFWNALAVNRGGMASHGGIIGIILGCIFFARRNQLPVLHVFDLTTLGASIGICLGRIANFINGELVGRPCDKDFTLATQFPQDLLDWRVWLNPDLPPVEKVYTPDTLNKLSQLAADTSTAITTDQWNKAATFVQTTPLAAPSATREMFEAKLTAIQTIDVGISNIIDAVQSNNTQVIEALRSILVTRHPSQLYASALEGALIFIVLALVWFKPRKPGIIASLFVLIYAIVRIFNEQFRMPDSHIGFEALGLTRGQWLSVAMLGMSIALFIFCLRRKADKLGGWGQPVKVDPIEPDDNSDDAT